MPPVLIVGAGPTGLAAALFLARADISCRLAATAPQLRRMMEEMVTGQDHPVELS